jgi:glycosyltransferase involved in cell wall biosynthesis
MRVLDNEQYLSSSLESVLNQTFTDFELLVISEYDTNRESLQIIDSYHDPRIRHIHNPVRLGLVRSLNVGLTNAKGRYIAPFDADDVNFPLRFEKQVEFLDDHHEVGVLGARYDIINEEGKVTETPKPTLETELIKWRLLFGECAVAHSSVMVRREVYSELGGYNPEVHYGEDYELWVRAIEVTQIANLPDTLLQLRRHSTRVSIAHELEQQQNTRSISQRALSSTFGVEVPFHYLDVIMFHRPVGGSDTVEAARWMSKRCREYVLKSQMQRKDKNSIRAFTAKKLYPLALICAWKWPSDSARIWRLILELDPIGSTWLWLDLLTRTAAYPVKLILRGLSPAQQ